MPERAIAPSAELRRLVARNAPLWAGEAEVVRSYFDGPTRSRERDREWVLRQLYKEYWDGIVPPLAALGRLVPALEQGVARAELVAAADVLAEEVRHYALFADLYERLGGAAPAPEALRARGAWAENDALMALRARHREQHGALGVRAYRFTEGGYCTLFSEGMRLAGRGGDDDAIAAVCAAIHDDEFEHMLLGVVDLDDDSLDGAGWALLGELTTAQLALRIEMRNAQFGYPLSRERVAALRGGAAAPLAFDYARATALRAARAQHTR